MFMIEKQSLVVVETKIVIKHMYIHFINIESNDDK